MSRAIFCEGDGHRVWRPTHFNVSSASEGGWLLDGARDAAGEEDVDDEILAFVLAGGAAGGITPSTRYLRALYWALGTMSSLGYGSSPVAITDAEYLWAVVCQVRRALACEHARRCAAPSLPSTLAPPPPTI